jgi:hypothetical protein
MTAHLVNGFSVFCEARSFSTVFIRARHRALTWADWIQSTLSHPISVRFILISSHLRLGLPSSLEPSCFPTKILYAFLSGWYFSRSYHHRQNSRFWAIAFLRRFCQICRPSSFHFLDFAIFFLQSKAVSLAFNPQPGGPGLCIYVPQSQGGQIISPGSGFSFRLLRLAGLRWNYSDLPISSSLIWWS